MGGSSDETLIVGGSSDETLQRLTRHPHSSRRGLSSSTKCYRRALPAARRRHRRAAHAVKTAKALLLSRDLSAAAADAAEKDTAERRMWLDGTAGYGRVPWQTLDGMTAGTSAAARVMTVVAAPILWATAARKWGRLPRRCVIRS